MLKRTLVMNQGETFSYSFEFLDSNGNSYNSNLWTPRSQMRKHAGSSTSYSFSCSLSGNNLVMSMTAFETSLIPSGSYLYDVEVEKTDETVVKALSGIITVFDEITK